LPLWIPYLSIPLGIGLLSLQYVADILALASGDAMPFGMDSHSSSEGE
jgi:TRAP-type C4-dicarboxylate transport system permease small subunit